MSRHSFSILAENTLIMPTFIPELNHRPKSDGTFTIMIRVTAHRKTARIAIGYSIKNEQWNSRLRQVRSNHPNHAVLNQRISLKIRELERVSISLGQDISAHRIIDSLNVQDHLVVELFDELEKEFTDNEEIVINEIVNFDNKTSKYYKNYLLCKKIKVL